MRRLCQVLDEYDVDASSCTPDVNTAEHGMNGVNFQDYEIATLECLISLAAAKLFSKCCVRRYRYGRGRGRLQEEVK